MKKKIILAVLFLLPVTIVLFLLLTTHNYNKLDVIGNDVSELVDYNSLEKKDTILFEDRITILGFLGKDVKNKKINILNLNQKIYKRFGGFKNFQFVVLISTNQQNEIIALKNEISRLSEKLDYWNFIEVKDAELQRIFDELESPLGLDANLSSDYVYIIDKDRNLRGRLDDRTDAEKEAKNKPYMLYGYNTISISELSGEMTDDLRVLFQEYRDKGKKERSDDRREEDIKS